MDDEKTKNTVEIYYLKGSSEKENIDQRVNFLTTLVNMAQEKGLHLTESRQKYLNYSLVTFAALFTIGLNLPTKLYSISIFFILILLMGTFCLLDHRYHQYIHGWRISEKNFLRGISEVINYPTKDIKIVRYNPACEKETEIMSLQPSIFYFLICVSVILFIWSLKNYLNMTSIS